MQTKRVISVPSFSNRTWKTVQDLLKTWNESDLIEIANRYCDYKDREKEGRINRAIKVKAALALYEQMNAAGTNGTKVEMKEDK